MPSFTFLKSPRKQSEQIEVGDSGVSLENDNKESQDVVQQRSSKRQFFRSLLKRSSLSSETQENRRRSGQFSVWNRSFSMARVNSRRIAFVGLYMNANYPQ
jgi:hypothetical protein